MERKQILCRGKDGATRAFLVKRVDPFESEIMFSITGVGPSWSEIPGEFHFKVMDDSRGLKVTMMSCETFPDYCGKGIPEAMIEFVSKTFNKVVVSSSNDPNQAEVGESRKLGATKAWCRLMRSGKAVYHPDRDYFEFVDSGGIRNFLRAVIYGVGRLAVPQRFPRLEGPPG